MRWNGALSSQFKVFLGVRQGGILSPVLFNVYVDDIIYLLQNSGYGCYVNKLFFGCIMYADDLLLISPSVKGLQYMLNICYDFGSSANIVFNSSKSFSIAVGHKKVTSTLQNLQLGADDICWVNRIKYLGIYLLSKSLLEVDVVPIKRSYYSALNSVICRCKYASEPVKIQLVKSYCLPLLQYCLGAIELNCSALRQLSIAWNDAFRKIFNYNRWESVKLLIHYCGMIDFVHTFDTVRLNFLHSVCHKFEYVSDLYNIMELQFNTRSKIAEFYGCPSASAVSYSFAVSQHFHNLFE